jgi:hypothetical protein
MNINLSLKCPIDYAIPDRLISSILISHRENLFIPWLCNAENTHTYQIYLDSTQYKDVSRADWIAFNHIYSI